jgi:hypothetical protein
MAHLRVADHEGCQVDLAQRVIRLDPGTTKNRESSNLRRAGISGTVIMKIGGWKTRSVFERYAIVNRRDIAEAMVKLESNRRELEGHAISHRGDSVPNHPTSTAIN